MVKAVAAVGRDVEVFESIVVVIANGNAHAIASSLQTGFLRDVFKGAIGLLMVKAVPVFGSAFGGN